jgi:hypothetical protein
MDRIVKKERRLNQRFPYKYPVRYMAFGDFSRPPDKAPIEGGVLDLSNGGMRLKTTNPGFEKRGILKVWLPVSRGKINVPLLAEVRWTEEQPAGTFHAGLMFMA